MMAMAPTPRFILLVSCDTNDTIKVPRKAAPLPQISYRPKYSPLFSGGISLAKYERDSD